MLGLSHHVTGELQAVVEDALRRCPQRRGHDMQQQQKHVFAAKTWGLEWAEEECPMPGIIISVSCHSGKTTSVRSKIEMQCWQMTSDLLESLFSLSIQFPLLGNSRRPEGHRSRHRAVTAGRETEIGWNWVRKLRERKRTIGRKTCQASSYRAAPDLGMTVLPTCTVLTLDQMLSSPAAAASPPRGVPPGTPVLPPKTSLSPWKIQALTVRIWWKNNTEWTNETSGGREKFTYLKKPTI